MRTPDLGLSISKHNRKLIEDASKKFRELTSPEVIQAAIRRSSQESDFERDRRLAGRAI